MTAGSATLARVLVVDDDRLIRDLVRDAICEQVRVECCDSGEAALEALHREPAELVISDIIMPGLSGIELLDEVQRSHPNTDFVLITANATVESAVRALRMGAADYLTKPINGDELSLVVERILSRHRLIVENAKLRDTLRIVDSCQNLMRCLEPGEVFAIAIDLLLQNLPRQRGVALFRRGSIPLSFGVVLRGFAEQEARRLHSVLLGDKPIEIASYSELEILFEGEIHDLLRVHGIDCGAIAAIPIRSRGEVAGVLWVFEEGRPFAADEIERAKLVAAHANLALRNAEQYNEAKERAFIDDVTEVYNARYLLEAADREIQRAERYGKPMTVLFLDLDRFKLVNDRYGHLVGSRALRRLSEVLAECIRQVDTLARYGGDEFTILLCDTNHERGLEIGERIRATVSEAIFEAGRESTFRLTISVGVASYPLHSTERATLLDLSDKAMYRAKSLGRNCVCSASDLSD